jgi:hypothetical protein
MLPLVPFLTARVLRVQLTLIDVGVEGQRGSRVSPARQNEDLSFIEFQHGSEGTGIPGEHGRRWKVSRVLTQRVIQGEFLHSAGKEPSAASDRFCAILNILKNLRIRQIARTDSQN